LTTYPAALHFVFSTRYFRFIARHHWIHHQYPDYNFNLLPGGDFLLGRHRQPVPADLQDMAVAGLRLHDPGGRQTGVP
jgi:hypothetical protein